MTPAERFAALRTLEAALKAVIGDAGEETIQAGSDSGADRWRTPYGTVTIVTRDDKPVAADEAGPLAWCRENHPGEIVETVRPSFVKAVMDRAEVIEGQVIDTQTGEVLPWAMVRAGTTYVSTPTSEAKDKATATWEILLRDRLDAIETLTRQAIETPPV